MDKTVLLGAKNEFSDKANRILHFSIAALFMVNGITNLTAEDIRPFSGIVGALMVAGSIFYFIYGFMAFSKVSKYAPRVSINSEGILLKSHVLKSSHFLAWNSIQRIEYGPYNTKFKIDSGEYIFEYTASADTSIQIKDSIREGATLHNIEVISG